MVLPKTEVTHFAWLYEKGAKGIYEYMYILNVMVSLCIYFIKGFITPRVLLSLGNKIQNSPTRRALTKISGRTVNSYVTQVYGQLDWMKREKLVRKKVAWYLLSRRLLHLKRIEIASVQWIFILYNKIKTGRREEKKYSHWETDQLRQNAAAF